MPIILLSKFIVIVSLFAVSQGQQCSVDRLPPFGDARFQPNAGEPDIDRFQAIVHAYRFQCSGRVTEWRACAHPAGRSTEQYYIQFQVWRPITGSTDGCYELVDYNIPQDRDDIAEAEEFLSPPGDNNDPLGRCVVLPVRENHQIEFQSGDVVGYYVDRFRNGNDEDNGGIQWIGDHNDVVIHYRDNLPRNDIQSYYAIGGPNPTECGFPISGNSDLYTLTDSTSAAPIISLSIGTSISPDPTYSVQLYLTTNAATALLPSSPPAGPLPLDMTGMVLTSAQTLPLTLSPASPPPVIPTTSKISTLLSSSLPTTSYISSSPAVLTSSPCISSDDMCGDMTEVMDNSTYVNIAAGISISLLVIIIVTVVVILVLLCLRRRKVKSELVDNVAYNCHECEIKTDTNAAYHTVNNDVITATNAAYCATSVPSTSGENAVDIATSTNEAYISTDIATSVDVAYEPVQSSSDNGTVDVTTLEYDYPRQEN